MNQLCAIGLKVLAAAGVGVAVYFGIDKMISGRKEQSSPVNDNPNQEPSPQQTCDCDNNVNLPESNKQQISSGEKVVSGLKVAQDVFGRAFSLCQNLAMAAENIIKIFGKNTNYSQGGHGYGYGYGNNYNEPYRNGYQDKYKDPPGYRRLSPFILEYVGGPVDERCFQQY